MLLFWDWNRFNLFLLIVCWFSPFLFYSGMNFFDVLCGYIMIAVPYMFIFWESCDIYDHISMFCCKWKILEKKLVTRKLEIHPFNSTLYRTRNPCIFAVSIFQSIWFVSNMWGEHACFRKIEPCIYQVLLILTIDKIQPYAPTSHWIGNNIPYLSPSLFKPTALGFKSLQKAQAE